MSSLNSFQKRQNGSTLLAAMLVALLASALTGAILTDTLAEAHIAVTELEGEISIRTAHSMLRLAIGELALALDATHATDWSAILAGPVGLFDSCGPPDLNPVRPEDAALSSLGTLCAACGDDGTLPWPMGGVPIIGKAGLLVLSSATIHQRLISPPESQACGSIAEASAADMQVWFKLSDNPEPDDDPARDTDALAILRIVIARRGRPSSTGRQATGGLLNTVVVLESWLGIGENSKLRVISVREIPYG